MGFWQRAQQSERRPGAPRAERAGRRQKEFSRWSKMNRAFSNSICFVALLVTGGESLAQAACSGGDLFMNGNIPRLRIDLSPEAVANLRTNAREFVAATVTE